MQSTLFSRATCSWEIFLKIQPSCLGSPGCIMMQGIGVLIQSSRETQPSSHSGHVTTVWVKKLPNDFWPRPSCHLEPWRLPSWGPRSYGTKTSLNFCPQSLWASKFWVFGYTAILKHWIRTLSYLPSTPDRQYVLCLGFMSHLKDCLLQGVCKYLGRLIGNIFQASLCWLLTSFDIRHRLIN